MKNGYLNFLTLTFGKRLYYTHFTPNIKEYSGYYAFDALWIKIDELGNKWVFLLALADVLHNTLVAYKIVEKETEEVL